ncbi:hypothetical protein LTT02_00450 [Mycolicibacterium smegmatis]|uniref:hypothetical protein n=1 Tax=Mycolicibacterium smegmatis TaxID=1772 RepID=UPI00071AF735|nr:hypothetical protein [Mycolicibacterium smegmatis]MCP2621508.1 hypothetical protein [Mycolicibacterium smegmatis]MDF1899561.1 hypothetical protein [Mycolicibacterium smegmatis]MDF1905132.1 hypothetical protein [Mycolicibacterium smegmatis]MDF1918880.1 hypothetical protein [Mycolicibacterium smegmatis]MDF1924150.1 hypothetical protein [Mycolicibacterium smegmatis]
MRTAVILAASVLVAGCASGGREAAPTSQPELSVPASTTHTTSAKPSPTTPIPTAAPAAGTPMPQVIRWVEAGTLADVAGFHNATRDGETTDLGDDIAFVAAGARCVTEKLAGGQLACLVTEGDLPSKPSDVEGNWVAGWVDFAGPTVDVGSLHGDPGLFTYGDGAELTAGQSLAFGDYRCRADASALVCVNFAHQSGIRLDDKGVAPLGCLRPVNPPVGVGRQFSCEPD